MTRELGDRWTGGDVYEAFMGRWSRAVAQIFIEWLPSRPFAHWLDVVVSGLMLNFIPEPEQAVATE